jgi:hypothetical protein
MSDKDVEVLKRNVDKILNYLHNDEGTGAKGLVSEVAELKKSFSEFKIKYETSQAVRKATIGAWATFGGFVALAAKWVGSLIINHFHF